MTEPNPAHMADSLDGAAQMTRVHRLLLPVVAIGALSAPSTAQDATVAVESLERVQRASAQVRYTMKYDGDDAPSGGAFRYRCPNCGNMHSRRLDQFLDEERKPVAAGYFIAPDLVITNDPGIQSRFLEQIEVVVGDRSIRAQPDSVGIASADLVLRLAEPIESVEPLTFSRGEPPYSAASYTEGNGRWHVSSRPVRETMSVAEDFSSWTTADSRGVILDSTGAPVTVLFDGNADPNVDWRTAPLERPRLRWDARERLLGLGRDEWSSGIVRVDLEFRSPRNDADSMGMGFGYSQMYYDDDLASSTRWDGLGVLLDSHRMLVLALLPPKTTARLETITAHLPGGEPRVASFAGSLRQFGAFVATFDDPVSTSLALSTQDIVEHRDDLLVAANVTIEGEERVAHFEHFRMGSFDRGWKDRLYPDVPDSHEDAFFFDREGRLVALPLQRRRRIDPDGYNRWSDNLSIPIRMLTSALDDIDEENRPLSAEAESRLAWLGLELQALDPELARYHNVSTQTQDGQYGAIVTHVYPESPASDANIEVGDVLIRLHVDEFPKPINIVATDMGMSMYGGQFPWDLLDQLPEQFFGEIPPPWPTAESMLNRTLTDLGAGAAFRLEYAREGETLNAAMTVTLGPPHYASAPKLKDEATGLTLRDLTYEVRHFFQMGSSDPGVVISNVESGSKASIAGIKPFEIVTSINGEEVTSVEVVERLLDAGGTIHLNVKRMGRGRVVDIEIE